MKHPYLIVISSFAGVIIVMILYFSSNINSIRKNGFKRSYHVYNLKPINVLNIESNAWYISGLTDNRIFLGNISAPLHLITSSYDLKDTSHVRLAFKYSNKIDWTLAKINVDSPYVYLSEYATPSMLYLSFSSNTEQNRHLKYFVSDEIKIISSSSIIVRRYDTTAKQKILQKVIVSPIQKNSSYYKPILQNDASLSIDGFFIYNKEKAKIFYTYYYRNEFICLDTNINVLYASSTIDTNKIAKIKTDTVTSDASKITMHSAPPLIVNKRGYSFGEWIYINSALASDNEIYEQFKNNSVIDIYNVKNGLYHHSISIPNYLNSRMSDFAVYKDRLIAIYDHYLVTYKLL